MKKLLVFLIIFITSCSTKDELSITDENKLFSFTKETAVIVCGGKSRLIESKNEEIIKVEIIPTNNELKISLKKVASLEKNNLSKLNKVGLNIIFIIIISICVLNAIVAIHKNGARTKIAKKESMI